MTFHTDLEIPLIHLNGTSRETLEEQVSTAYRAILNAVKALEGMAPNGRDYYPRGDAAFARATEQHRSRADRLVAIKDELMAYHMLLVDQ